MKNIKSTILLSIFAFYSPFLLGQGGNPSQQPKREKNPVNVVLRDKNSKESAMFTALSDRQLLQGIQKTENASLVPLSNCFKEFGCFDHLKGEHIKASITRLQNLVHTIASDKELFHSLEKEPHFIAFIEQLTAFMNDICNHILGGCKTDELQIKKSADSLSEIAMNFLTHYSKTLTDQVKDSFSTYNQTNLKVLRTLRKEHEAATSRFDSTRKILADKMELLESARSEYVAARDNNENLTKRLEKIEDTCFALQRIAPTLRSDKDKENLSTSLYAASQSRASLKIATNNWKAAQNNVTRAQNEVQKAKSANDAAQQVMNDAQRKYKDTSTKASNIFTNTLATFDTRTIGLINNRACQENSRLGRLNTELVYTIFNHCEQNPGLARLVEQGCTLFEEDEVLFNEFMLILQRYICCAYSQDEHLRLSAKGFIWELAVGMYFYEKLKQENSRDHTFKSLGSHVQDTKTEKFYEFDITTSKLLIECKNIDWNRYSNGEMGDKLAKIKLQKSVADCVGKKFLIVSRKLIPKEIREFFTRENILFMDPERAQSPSTFESTYLKKDGFEELYSTYAASVV